MGIAIALLLGAVSGILLATADIISLPAPIAAICAVACVLSVVLIGLLAFRDARREHVSPVRAVGRSLRAGASWMLELM